MTHRKKYTLVEAMRMDQHIMNLASYELSQGMVMIPSDLNAIMEFQDEVKRQFSKFKRMVQMNECTLEELEQMVVQRHGPVPDPYANLSMSEALNLMAEESLEEEPKPEAVDAGNKLLAILLGGTDTSNGLGAGMNLFDKAISQEYVNFPEMPIPSDNPSVDDFQEEIQRELDEEDRELYPEDYEDEEKDNGSKEDKSSEDI